MRFCEGLRWHCCQTGEGVEDLTVAGLYDCAEEEKFVHFGWLFCFSSHVLVLGRVGIWEIDDFPGGCFEKEDWLKLQKKRRRWY